MPDPVPGEKPAGDEKPPETKPTDQLTPEQLAAQLAETQKALKAANAEAAERRVKLAAFEKAEADRVAATLSETEKLTQAKAELEKRLAKAENERVQTEIKHAVIAKAAALGFADPNDAYGLLDMAKVTVKDDGTVSGVDEALAEMAKAKAYMLKRAPQAPLHPGNPGGAGDQEETDQQKLARIYGANGASQVFGPKAARERGGGVIVGKTE